MYTVKGELRVARFLVNFFNIVGRVGLWLVWLVPGRYAGVPDKGRIGGNLFFLPLCQPAFVSATTMAPQLDAAQHILIESLLNKGFETKLIASEASCSVRAVQRIRRKRQLFEMPILRTNRSAVVAVLHRPCKRPSSIN
jgi:hypothetical protein